MTGIVSHSENDVAQFRRFAGDLADIAAAITLPLFRGDHEIANKLEAGFDPVTEADRGAEAAIRAAIEKKFPNHGILGEEYGEQEGASAFRWVLDPVDGTRAFIAGIPTWTTLIALEIDRVPMIGIIDQPYIRERWTGAPGGTIFRNQTGEKKIRCAETLTLGEATLSTTDPRKGEYFTDSEAVLFDRLSENCRLTRFGMDAYAYGLVASGGIDLVAESGLKRYDAASHIPVIENAGGLVTDWQGRAMGPDWDQPESSGGQAGRILAAANSKLHSQALQFLEMDG